MRDVAEKSEISGTTLTLTAKAKRYKIDRKGIVLGDFNTEALQQLVHNFYRFCVGGIELPTSSPLTISVGSWFADANWRDFTVYKRKNHFIKWRVMLGCTMRKITGTRVFIER